MSVTSAARYTFRRCRLVAHRWDVVDTLDWEIPAEVLRHALPMQLRCTECGMARRDLIDKGTGDIIARRYLAPVGYYFQRGETPRRAEFRKAWIDDEVARIREERKARKKKETG